MLMRLIAAAASAALLAGPAAAQNNGAAGGDAAAAAGAPQAARAGKSAASASPNADVSGSASASSSTGGASLTGNATATSSASGDGDTGAFTSDAGQAPVNGYNSRASSGAGLAASTGAPRPVLPASSGALGDPSKLEAGDPGVVSNGPVPDTVQNREKFGQPNSMGGRRTKPTGD